MIKKGNGSGDFHVNVTSNPLVYQSMGYRPYGIITIMTINVINIFMNSSSEGGLTFSEGRIVVISSRSDGGIELLGSVEVTSDSIINNQ